MATSSPIMTPRIIILAAIPACLLLTQCAELNEELEREARQERHQHNHQGHKHNHHHEGHRHGAQGEQPATYGVGFEKGRRDGMNGKSRNPGRHENSYSEADRGEFFRGYEAGYNVGIQ